MKNIEHKKFLVILLRFRLTHQAVVYFLVWLKQVKNKIEQVKKFTENPQSL